MAIQPHRYLLSFVSPFFLRSAHRFFISSDSRFLPSLVIPPRLFLFVAPDLGAAIRPLLPEAIPAPTKAVIARISRSLSFFKSATILSISKYVLLWVP